MRMYLSKLTFRYLLTLSFCLISIYIYVCMFMCRASLHIYSIEQFCCNPYFCIAMVALFFPLFTSRICEYNEQKTPMTHFMRVCTNISICVQCSAVQCSFLLCMYVYLCVCKNEQKKS